VNARRMLGGYALAVALGVLSAFVLAGWALSLPSLLASLATASGRVPIAATVLGMLALAALAIRLNVLTARVPRGTQGRLRLLTLGYGAAALALGGLATTALLMVIGYKLPSGAPLSLEDASYLVPGEFRIGLFTVAGWLVLSALVASCGMMAAWFMLPRRARMVVFALIDSALVVAFAWYSYQYELAPTQLTPEAITGASLRLVVTLVLGARFAIRLIPLVLDLVERVDMRSLVAARHLRAKKSGFLAAISFLSILAVSVSSCALTTTLSVMGGFRQDLKRKILGNNAHIVIDRPDGKLAGYGALSEAVRNVPGVRGVSPYLSGEVMISSASNLAGAVLRGIDVDRIGEVSELPKNMRVGSLEFLKDPAQLKSAPLNPLGATNLGIPKSSLLGDASDAAPGKSAPLSEELRKAIDEAAKLSGVKPSPMPTPPDLARAPDGAPRPDASRRDATRIPAGSTLPGIVVGQELARSLRLYLGDEVNVVTPLGELGPSGPMPKSRPFRVAGIFYSGMYEYDMKFAYVTLAAAQRFLGAGDEASGIEITVREPERAQESALQIAKVTTPLVAQQERKPGAAAVRVRAWQELNKNLFGALALEKLAMFIALGIAILVASFCIVGTLTLMVQEKGREVAVLKAMGAKDRAIVAIFVLEGTLIGVFGSLIGLGLGYGVCFAAEHFGVKLNPEVYYIDRLPVHIDPNEFLTVGLAAIAVSLLVTIYPAKLASRLRPVDALRYE
jgi:lipoprotein-releasing system permease protein